MNVARHTVAAGALRILAVGQLPPPHGGQSVMMEALCRADLSPHRLRFVQMKFTTDMSNVSVASLRKVLVLGILIGKIVAARFYTGCDILLYPPAGPDRSPMLRDIVVLCCTRWLFRRTIFYFHAGGVMSFVRSQRTVLRRVAEIAYGRPDLAIRTSSGAPADGRECNSQRDVVIHNGVADLGPYRRHRRIAQRPRILYVGIIKEDKGVLVLLDALTKLRLRQVEADLSLVGASVPRSFDDVVRSWIRRNGLEDRVRLHGVLTGRAKAAAYYDADVFCFPTYFAAETSGLVVMEAMSCNLPVVATSWRGLPEIVDDGDSGFLVPPQNAEALAERLEMLIRDYTLRWRMGEAARAKYERIFTIDAFVARVRAEMDTFASMR